jgi:hypothetical protein
MGKIVIKKRITLEFLGDEYKDAYLTFDSIALGEADELAKKAIQAAEDKRSNEFLRGVLEDLFVGGMFPDDKGQLFEVTVENIKELDLETSAKVFDILTGQAQSPKV